MSPARLRKKPLRLCGRSAPAVHRRGHQAYARASLEIKPEDFHALSVAAMANVSTPSNPRQMTVEAFEELFKKAYAGE